MVGFVGRRLVATVLVVLGLALGVAVGVAFGFSTSSDVSAAPFATDFPSQAGIGPVGLAFDGGGRLYVTATGDLYRFGSDGGQASGRRVNSKTIPGRIAGLAFGASGRLYATRMTSRSRGDVVELDTGDGHVVREVANGLPCPTGLALNPVTNALYVSAVECDDKVFQISDGKASTFLSGVYVDGLTFGSDGTLYLAHAPDGGGYTVSSVTASGERTGLAKVPHTDGIAIASSEAASGNPPFLVINRTDGNISRVDLNQAGHPWRNLVTDGTRGDFVAVGGDGCLYATRSREVLKVTNRDGSCTGGSGIEAGIGVGLEPTGPTAGAFVSVSGGSKAKPCSRRRRLFVRYRARRGIRVTRARIYVGRKLTRRVSGRALRRRVTVTRLPKARFTLTIRATTTRGRTIVVRRKYGLCAGVTVQKRR